MEKENNDPVDILGKSFDEVKFILKSRNINYRITEINGKKGLFTADLNFERVNLQISGDKVCGYWKG